MGLSKWVQEIEAALARDSYPGETLEKIRQKAPAARLHAFQADFASFSDVRRLAAEVSKTVTKLDLLVNNAAQAETPRSPGSAWRGRAAFRSAAPA